MGYAPMENLPLGGELVEGMLNGYQGMEGEVAEGRPAEYQPVDNGYGLPLQAQYAQSMDYVPMENLSLGGELVEGLPNGYQGVEGGPMGYAPMENLPLGGELVEGMLDGYQALAGYSLAQFTQYEDYMLWTGP